MFLTGRIDMIMISSQRIITLSNEITIGGIVFFDGISYKPAFNYRWD